MTFFELQHQPGTQGDTTLGKPVRSLEYIMWKQDKMMKSDRRFRNNVKTHYKKAYYCIQRSYEEVMLVTSNTHQRKTKLTGTRNGSTILDVMQWNISTVSVAKVRQFRH